MSSSGMELRCAAPGRSDPQWSLLIVDDPASGIRSCFMHARRARNLEILPARVTRLHCEEMLGCRCSMGITDIVLETAPVNTIGEWQHNEFDHHCDIYTM